MESYLAPVVAILGHDTPSLCKLAERVQGLGHPTLHVSHFGEAIEQAEERKLRFSAALLDPEIRASKLGRELNEVRRRTRSAGLVYIAAGRRPQQAARSRLSQAGVELALWDPASDHDLLFQINRATSGWTHDQLRGDFRAPADWTTRVLSSGREKLAHVYTFSGSGAFLATGRPSLKGASLVLDLPLPSGPVRVAGRVVYTNVPGNRRLPRLPTGMAVQFDDLPEEIESAIRDSVDQRTSDLSI